MLAHAGISVGVAGWLWGVAGLIALWGTWVVIYNLGDAVNSVAHLYGERPTVHADHSRNNGILALLTFGDGWHADHHQLPGSARLGFGPGKVDLGWAVIRVFEWLRLADHVRVPGEQEVQAKLNPPEGRPLSQELPVAASAPE